MNTKKKQDKKPVAPKMAVFVKSSSDYTQCPPAKCPEFAFIGRSNVGKSSLINMLAQTKDLAKISSKPGKTRLINHFNIYDKWYLVDLPGYGYARVAKTELEKFSSLIKDYIVNRENLHCLFVLVDSRLEPQDIDIEFINWLGENGIPFVVVFTKTDKLSDNKVDSNVSKFKKVMSENWEELPQMFYTSTVERIGRDEILQFINNSL